MLWVIQRDFLQGKSVQQLVADALAPVPNQQKDKAIAETNNIRASLASIARNSTGFRWGCLWLVLKQACAAGSIAPSAACQHPAGTMPRLMVVACCSRCYCCSTAAVAAACHVCAHQLPLAVSSGVPCDVVACAHHATLCFCCWLLLPQPPWCDTLITPCCVTSTTPNWSSNTTAYLCVIVQTAGCFAATTLAPNANSLTQILLLMFAAAAAAACRSRTLIAPSSVSSTTPSWSPNTSHSGTH
jgi:hypothetical protein